MYMIGIAIGYLYIGLTATTIFIYLFQIFKVAFSKS